MRLFLTSISPKRTDIHSTPGWFAPALTLTNAEGEGSQNFPLAVLKWLIPAQEGQVLGEAGQVEA